MKKKWDKWLDNATEAADLGYIQGFVILIQLLGPEVKNKIHEHPLPLCLASNFNMSSLF